MNLPPLVSRRFRNEQAFSRQNSQFLVLGLIKILIIFVQSYNYSCNFPLKLLGR